MFLCLRQQWMQCWCGREGCCVKRGWAGNKVKQNKFGAQQELPRVRSCESRTSWDNTSAPHLPGLIVLICSFTLAMGGINAARTLHAALLENKFHTPQSFYDTTPTGRIINRFSKDIYIIDEVIPPTILMFLGTFFTSLSTMIVIIASTPLFAVVIIPLAILYFFVQVTGKMCDSYCDCSIPFLFRENSIDLGGKWKYLK